MQRLGCAVYGCGVQSQVLQLVTEHFATAGVVIHQHQRLTCPSRRQALCTKRGIDQGMKPDIKAESAAVPELAVDADVAAHHAHQAAADGQTQASAAKPAHGAGVGLGEHIKNQGLLVGGDADAGVFDRELQPDTIAAGRGNHGLHEQQNFTLCHEFDGIAQQVGDHLLQTQGVTNDLVGHLAVHVTLQFKFFFTCPQGQCACSLPNQAVQGKRVRVQTELAGFDF